MPSKLKSKHTNEVLNYLFKQGDSGGPVIHQESSGKWSLTGITSWGRGCGDIGVYSRVNVYLAWVQTQMNNNP